jgi:3-dehydroquinate synthetase
MVAEARIGETAGITEPGTAARLEEAARALDLPALPALDPQAILRAAGADKKNRAGAIRCTLLRGIGEVARAADGSWTHEVSADQLARHAAQEVA